MTIEIRDAQGSDAEALAPLMEQFMHRPCMPEQIRSRLRRLAATGVDRVMVAVLDGRVVGLVAVTYAWLFHLEAPTARLMSIVVDEDSRGGGIGRRLVEASIDQARAWSCDRLELTSRLERSDAHSFYETVGFAQTSKKFQMSL